MAENYGSLEGTLDEHGMLSGEMNDRATLEGEIQFGSGGGGVLDVFQNGQSVVEGRYAYVIVPTFLKDLRADDYHNTVTRLEMEIWNGKANPSDIPTKLSELDNDANYVQDADYVHTDNNFTEEDKAAIGNIPENITDLSDVAVDNIQNGQVLKWDATQEKFVNADESGGGGDVTDVKVNGTSVVDPVTKEAEIDLSGYAEKSDLGTASALDVASSGDASTSQVVKGDDTRLTDARPASDVSSWAKASTKPDYTASEVGAIATTAKGTANGVAELDENGKVPSAQLPSYVDDVLEYASVSAFPATGESGKIYIALDTNKTYRWSGTTYTEISESLALGETDSTAYAGNKGKQNADNIAAIQGLIPSSATTSNKLATASDIPDISGKADKSEMSVSTSGDQTTIQLKNGTSATVLNAHQSITGKADKVTNATENNFAALDANGNLKDSGHKHSDYLTQHQDISGKADKVTNATNGNLAGLNASGNLTDSGWNGAKDTMSISGNPISISGLKANQLAVNPIITLEPIQAGSGTPSPVNQRPISGYDKVEALSCGKNLCDEQWRQGDWNNTTPTNRVAIEDDSRIFLKAGTTYYIYNSGYATFSWSAAILKTKNASSYSDVISWQSGQTATYTPAYNCYMAIVFNKSNANFTPSELANVNFMVCENSLTDKTYVPYDKTTSISESLGQTVYGGSLELRTGVLTVDRVAVDMSTLTWTSIARDTWESNAITNIKYGTTTSTFGNISEQYQECSTSDLYNNTTMIGFGVHSDGKIRCRNLLTSEPAGNLVYKLATPFTIQLTPHEISLLKNYAYASTNGTNIALDYHNGELASLSDVAQLSETVERLTEYIKGLINNA